MRLVIAPTIAHAIAQCNSSRFVSGRYPARVNLKEARRKRLEELLAWPRFGGEKKALAEAIGKAPAQVSQWVNSTRTINEESARHIEAKLRLPSHWMDGPAATVHTPPAGVTEPGPGPYSQGVPLPADLVASLRGLSRDDLARAEGMLRGFIASAQGTELGGATTAPAPRKLSSR